MFRILPRGDIKTTKSDEYPEANLQRIYLSQAVTEHLFNETP